MTNSQSICVVLWALIMGWIGATLFIRERRQARTPTVVDPCKNAPCLSKPVDEPSTTHSSGRVVANTLVNYNVIVFDVSDPDTTYVYVRIDPVPGDPCDCHPSVFGWHCKSYPSYIPTSTIHEQMLFRTPEHDPLMWPNCGPADVLHGL